jgi:hypothetical protein
MAVSLYIITTLKVVLKFLRVIGLNPDACHVLRPGLKSYFGVDKQMWLSVADCAEEAGPAVSCSLTERAASRKSGPADRFELLWDKLCRNPYGA